MYIIPLKGASNSGKTSSIKYLIIKMLGIADVKVIYTSKFSKSKSNKEELIKLIREPWYGKRAGLDITVLLEYTGKRIYITTNGDCIEDILKNLENVINKYGDIDVCVCGRHECNNVEQEFSSFSIKQIFNVRKERAAGENYNEDNQRSGTELLAKVEQILDM